MDTIAIDNLDVQTPIGVPEQERAQPQTIRVQIELSLDTRAAASADDISQTIDYAVVVTEVRQLASIQRNTLERFAQDIADTLLAKFSVQHIRVRVEKQPADLAGVRASVSILRP